MATQKSLVEKLAKVFPDSYCTIEKCIAWKAYEQVIEESWTVYVADHYCLQWLSWEETISKVLEITSKKEK